jgi:hypothetical protein
MSALVTFSVLLVAGPQWHVDTYFPGSKLWITVYNSRSTISKIPMNICALQRDVLQIVVAMATASSSTLAGHANAKMVGKELVVILHGKRNVAVALMKTEVNE